MSELNVPLEELIKAIVVKKHFNAMDQDDFMDLVEKYYNVKIPKEARKRWKLIGLMNHDLITCSFLQDYSIILKDE